MKLILTDDDGTVIDSWDSRDEYDLGAFEALAREGTILEFTRGPIKDMLKQRYDEIDSQEK